MNSVRLMLVGMAGAVVVGLLVSARMPAATTAPDLRKAAPDFTLKDSHGATIRLSDYKGKVVLLDFWATWCHGCKLEIPWFAEFSRKYGDKGVAVVGVSLDSDGWKVVAPFIKSAQVPYQIILGNDVISRAYGIENMPDTFLIDREGRVAAAYKGMVDKQNVEENLRAMLMEH